MIKDIYDYVDDIHRFYPYLSKEAIIDVFSYGCVMYDVFMKNKNPIKLGQEYSSVFFRHGFAESFDIYNFLQCQTTYRLKWKLSDKQFDGTYYFGLTDAEYQKYKSKLRVRSRKQNDPGFIRNIKIFKHREECLLYKKFKHFFSIFYPEDLGWVVTCPEIPLIDLKKIAYRDDTGQLIRL